MSSGWRALLAVVVVFVVVLVVMSLVLGSTGSCGTIDRQHPASERAGVAYPQPWSGNSSSSALAKPRSLIEQMRDDNSRLIEAS